MAIKLLSPYLINFPYGASFSLTYLVSRSLLSVRIELRDFLSSKLWAVTTWEWESRRLLRNSPHSKCKTRLTRIYQRKPNASNLFIMKIITQTHSRRIYKICRGSTHQAAKTVSAACAYSRPTVSIILSPSTSSSQISWLVSARWHAWTAFNAKYYSKNLTESLFGRKRR